MLKEDGHLAKTQSQLTLAGSSQQYWEEKKKKGQREVSHQANHELKRGDWATA